MLATYALIVRRSAAVTALAAGIMLAICGVVGGAKGVIGGLIAIGIVTGFFGISIAAVGRAAKVSPHLMMVTALGTYLLKIIALLILVGQFQDTTVFNPRLF